MIKATCTVNEGLSFLIVQVLQEPYFVNMPHLLTQIFRGTGKHFGNMI